MLQHVLSLTKARLDPSDLPTVFFYQNHWSCRWELLFNTFWRSSWSARIRNRLVFLIYCNGCLAWCPPPRNHNAIKGKAQCMTRDSECLQLCRVPSSLSVKILLCWPNNRLHRSLLLHHSLLLHRSLLLHLHHHLHLHHYRSPHQ